MKSPIRSELKTGVIYARYSSHAQRDCSIEQQVEKAQAFARERGIRIIEVYADRAISGKTDKRPAFQKMMAAAATHTFSYVIAWKSSRLGRDMLQAMLNEARLDGMGVKCLYVEEDYGDNASGRFALRSMMNVNQFYIENMAEDIRRGLIHSAQEGKALASMPYGYEKGPDGRYKVQEAEAEIVREIYRRVADGEAFASIYGDLNRRGIRTKRGSKWQKSSLAKILINPKYVGTYKYAEVVIPDGMPRIIPDELFEEVQKIMKAKKDTPEVAGRRRAGADEYLLTGKLYCGACKSPMIGLSGRGRHGDMHYYYACKKRRYDRACPKKSVVRDEIEQLIAGAITGFALTDDNIEKIADFTIQHAKKWAKNSSVGLCETHLSEINTAIKNIMDAIEHGIYTETTRDRLCELEDEKRAAARDLADARLSEIIPKKEDIVHALSEFKDGNLEDKQYLKDLFQLFLVGAYVYDDRVEIIFSAGDRKERARIAREIKNGSALDPERVRLSETEWTFSDSKQTSHYHFWPIAGAIVICVPLPEK